mmetsp:Transcript_42007/g.76295  ORF Transcript_42007/g.76295 Transcript_42007/m.76295 type:complete len:357 (+) Transcript_42007:115-1185(+)
MPLRTKRKSGHAVTAGALTYMVCSSLALVANKMVMTYVQASGLVFALQVLVTIGFVVTASVHGIIKVDPMRWDASLAFLPYVASFVLTQYSSGMALAQSNVETLIVFRATSPLLVSFLDWWFLGRELPERGSVLALICIIAGSVGYVLADSEFDLKGVLAYKWVTLNLLGVVFEMIYGKRLLDDLDMDAPEWTSVMYTNVLSLVPMVLLGTCAGEFKTIQDADLDHKMGFVPWLVASCVLGACLSWAGWNCRNLVSATVYTILGVLCKLMSVALNIALGNKHASPLGLTALCFTLMASATYKKSPMRQDTWDSCQEACASLEEACEDTKKERATSHSVRSAVQRFWSQLRAPCWAA